jgi:uncharacterized membrane protein YgdD (TMEM256/DUF423 family)
MRGDHLSKDTPPSVGCVPAVTSEVHDMRQAVSTFEAITVGAAGASAVVLGAFGAHALRGVLDAQASELWHTAVSYQFWHALALTLAVFAADGRSGRLAVRALALGILLFSGSLYALALGAPRLVGVITPFGGLAFIVGWVALAFGLRAGRRV